MRSWTADLLASTSQILAIHPFQDGNGRLSRVLTTLLLLQAGYRYVPYCSLERVIEENKDGYYQALRLSQKQIRTTDEKLDDWGRFFLQSLKKQKDTLLRKVEQEKLLEGLSPTSEQILVLVRKRGRLTISEAVTCWALTATRSSCICANWFSRATCISTDRAREPATLPPNNK